MAEEKRAALSAPYPAPPPFYKHFTPQNFIRLKEVRNSQNSSHIEDAMEDTIVSPEAPGISQAIDLPPEIRYLIPPKPPSTGLYRSFGGDYNIKDILPTLEDQGVEQLYPSPPHSPNAGSTSPSLDRAFYLKKIAKSLLLNFMELVGVLSVAPDQYGKKIEDLRTLFINAHHLLNEYRPHQARETLIMMMEEQLERSRAEIEGVRRMKEKIEGILEGLGGEGLGGDAKMGDAEARKVQENGSMQEEQRRIWEVLEAELGG
ncbi:MAG: Mediator of RNA polymerase II transcription subunit 7 [Pycnora praestabilis]|nr:MAG: Mediator of RNA polymerase II transcription subunit 7 [Pycnora praestabilis]